MEHRNHQNELRPEGRWFSVDGEEDATEMEPGSGNRRRPVRLLTARRLLTWMLLLLLTGLLLSLAYLKDEEMPWDDDLRRAVSTGETSDMSAPIRMKVLLQTARKVDMASLSVKPAAQWDTPTLAQVLEQHSAVLDNFRDLLEEKEEEWQPGGPLWKLEDFGTDSGWPAVLLMKQVETAYLARRGKEVDAFLSAIDMAVLGGLLERLDAWPSIMERALDLHACSSETLASLLKSTQLSADGLKTLQEAEYRPWQPSLENLRSAMSGFYTFERRLLMGPEGEEPPLPLGYIPARTGWVFFKPNATLKLFVESFRELKNATDYTPFARSDHITARLQHRMSGGRTLMNPNWSGEDYFASRIRFYAGLPDKVSLARARYALVMNLFALRRCVAAEFRVPKTLEELVPTYLDKAYLDPFSGEGLKYDPVRGLIYSVGEDLIDEGGTPTPIPMSMESEPTLETGIGVAKAAH